MNIFPRAKPTSVMVVPVVQKQLYRYAIYSRDCKHPIKVGTPRMLAPIPAANFESKHRCLLSRFYGTPRLRLGVYLAQTSDDLGLG